MRFTGKSMELARKARTEGGASFLGASLMYMLLSTVAFGVMALSGILPTALALCLGVYLYFAAGLFVNAPLLAAAHRNGRGVFGRLTLPRALIALALPLLFLAPAYGIYRLLDWVNNNWTVMMHTYMTSVPRMALGAAVIVGVIVLIVLALSLIGVFARFTVISLLESEKPASFGRILGASVKSIGAPVNLGIRFLPWLVLMAVLFLGGEVLACHLSGGFVPGLDWESQAILMLAWLVNQKAWITPLAAAAALVWVLGLGLIFWPRYHAARIYHYCRLMKQRGLL